MIGFTKINLRADQADETVLSELRSAMEAKGYDNDAINQNVAYVSYVLDHYRKRFGEVQEIEYQITKPYRRVRLRFSVKGERYSPLNFEDSDNKNTEVRLNTMLNNNAETITHKYAWGINLLSFTTAKKEGKSIFSNTTLWAVILGLALGLLCLLLPDSTRETIVNDVASPIRSTSISILTGIVSPMIFISILSAVASMENINQLTNLGFKIFKRFVWAILSVMGITIAIMLFFFHEFGKDISEFDFESLTNMLLNILPTDIITPFQENNTPQLVVLGILFGAAMLLLGNNVSDLQETIIQLNTLVTKAMNIVYILVPIIPFISIFMAVAQGDFSTLLNGWEFILAVYLITMLCGSIKLLKVSCRFKVKVSVLWKALWPLTLKSFSSGSFDAALQQEYEISKNKLGIKEEFSSFWIPMGYAMMSPAATIYMIVPSFLILKYSGTAISLTFIAVLLIMVLELSLASPGTTASWTILFAALSLSTDYVGLCVMYKLFCNNFTSGYVALQSGLEQIEAAAQFDSIDWSYLKESQQQPAA